MSNMYELIDDFDKAMTVQEQEGIIRDVVEEYKVEYPTIHEKAGFDYLLSQYTYYKWDYNFLCTLVQTFELLIKHHRFMLMKEKEEEIKSMTAREKMARDVYTTCELLVSQLRCVRDETLLKAQHYQYLLEHCKEEEL